MAKLKKLDDLIKGTQNKYAKRFYQLLLNEGYKIIEGSYINSRVKIKVECNRGHETVIRPDQFNKGTRCKYCSYEDKNKDMAEEYKSKLMEELDKSNFKLISPYKNSAKQVTIECSNNHIKEITPRAFIESKQRCLECERDSYVTRLAELLSEEKYTWLSGEYKNAHSFIEVVHQECNHQFTISANNFIRGKRCARCRQSKGEKLVEVLLKKFGYSYESQDTFEECKDIDVLRFDFGVYEDGKLIALVEYQGIHHYQPTDYAGRGAEWAEEEFKKTKVRDDIKRKFSKENDIPLIEVHYSLTDSEVSDFLLNNLGNHKYKEVS